MGSERELREVDPADLAAPMRLISQGYFIGTFITLMFVTPAVAGVFLAIGLLRLSAVSSNPRWRRRCEVMLALTVVGAAAAVTSAVLQIADEPVAIPVAAAVLCWLAGQWLYITHMRLLLDELERARLAARWHNAERRFYTCLLPAGALVVLALSIGFVLPAVVGALGLGGRYLIALCGAQGWTRAAAQYELEQRSAAVPG